MSPRLLVIGELHQPPFNELEQGLTRWLTHHNHERPHQALTWQTTMGA